MSNFAQALEAKSAEEQAIRRALWRQPRVVAVHLVLWVWCTLTQSLGIMLVSTPRIFFWGMMAVLILDSEASGMIVRDLLLMLVENPRDVRDGLLWILGTWFCLCLMCSSLSPDTVPYIEYLVDEHMRHRHPQVLTQEEKA